MRKLLAVATFGLLVAACAGDATEPAGSDVAARLDEMAVLAFGSVEAGEPGDPLLRRLGQLPPDLALTPEQRAAGCFRWCCVAEIPFSRRMQRDFGCHNTRPLTVGDTKGPVYAGPFAVLSGSRPGSRSRGSGPSSVSSSS